MLVLVVWNLAEITLKKLELLLRTQNWLMPIDHKARQAEYVHHELKTDDTPKYELN